METGLNMAPSAFALYKTEEPGYCLLYGQEIKENIN